MTMGDNTVDVIAISDQPATQNQITAALSAENEFNLLDVLSDQENLARAIVEEEPGIIVIDDQLGGNPALDIIADMAHQFPTIPIIAILPDDSIVSAQQVNRAGAQFFITQPFTQINLLSTLRRARELLQRRRQFIPETPTQTEEVRPLRTITVYSPRGGVGTTTIATNLAISLFEETGSHVLLLEGKLLFGHLDVFLNIRSRNTLADLVPHASALEQEIVTDVVTEHQSGIAVLLAPNDIQYAQGIRPQEIFSIVNSLKRWYEYIVIDAGSQLTENVVTMMDASDRVLLVSNPDMASLHDVTRFLTISQTLAYPADKVMVLINRADRMGGIKAKDIESVLRLQNIYQIPNDSSANLRSLNRGIPLVVKSPRNPTARSIRSLAKAIIQLDAKQQAQARTIKLERQAKDQAELATG
jgi:pilus assembly protein CpaE